MLPRELVHYFAALSVQLAHNEVLKVCKLAEVLKRWMWLLVLSFCARNEGRAVLEIYASDCTPKGYREQYFERLEDVFVRRSGKSCGEWLAERYFITNGSGDCEVLFSDPRLLEDKSAWSHYHAYEQLVPKMARENHHDAVTISHSVFDRAIQAPMAKHLEQRHKAYDLFLETELKPGEAFLAIQRSWVTSTGCFAHDAHNSLKWSVISFLGDREMMRDLWVVLESLRSSYDDLVRAFGPWVLEVLVFEDTDGAGLACLWELCGLKDPWLSVAVNLQLRWENNKLKVAECFRGDPEMLQAISMVVLHIWKLKTWSSSRWCGVGTQCRVLLASMLAGLRGLVDSIFVTRKDHYSLKGFRRLNTSVMQLVCVVAAASRVSECALAKVLDDDRLAKKLGRGRSQHHHRVAARYQRA